MQRNSVFEKRQNDTSQIKQENGLNVVHFTILWIIVIVIIITVVVLRLLQSFQCVL